MGIFLKCLIFHNFREFIKNNNKNCRVFAYSFGY